MDATDGPFPWSSQPRRSVCSTGSEARPPHEMYVVTGNKRRASVPTNSHCSPSSLSHRKNRRSCREKERGSWQIKRWWWWWGWGRGLQRRKQETIRWKIWNWKMSKAYSLWTDIHRKVYYITSFQLICVIIKFLFLMTYFTFLYYATYLFLALQTISLGKSLLLLNW